ncbi:MAG: VIT family protein [Proteobacteria bacterium]|nr:VIT family protein [Pseudomonadota bacterium]
MPAHTHRTHASGSTRAGVLGANDGILSIAGLMIGVASTHADRDALLLAGLAGLIAGALSMGAGEFVSVSSQADIERADLEIERRALETDFEGEHAELAEIYVRRGLDRELAEQVARQLMQHDALGAHARDDIGITEALSARPLQASLASMVSFAIGGLIPFLAAFLAPSHRAEASIAVVSLLSLAALGAVAAHAGGASVARGALRVLIWGAATMALTGAIGTLIGARG